MATVLRMPKLSDTMESGRILTWQKKEGEAVANGDVLAEVETDKASMEWESLEDGFLRKILVKDGESAAVDQPIAIITEKEDEAIDAVVAGLGKGGAAAAAPAPAPAAASPAPAPAPAAKAAPAPAPAAPAPAPAVQNGGGRVLASPLAARMAQELGLDLRRISGSGPEGRIIKRDIERAQAEGIPAPAPAAATAAPAQPAAAPAPAPKPFAGTVAAAGAAAAAQGAVEHVPVSTMRAVIARRLSESKNGIPHYYVSMDIDMEPATAFRDQLKDVTDVKVSFNDLIVKASALALQRHPMVNASWQGDHIVLYKQIDVSVAVAIEDGLITPVVRNVAGKGLATIAREVRDLATRARSRKLKPEEYTGGTFTISNLGMFGVAEFTAIINPPEAAILAVGGIREEPVVKGGAIVPGKRMKVTLSSDHRVIDGALAAEFLQTLKAMLENPASLAL